MKRITLPWGGIHPPSEKHAAGLPIITAPVPSQLSIVLTQHIGAPAMPVVKVGDTVLVGSLIAIAQGSFSSSYHAPASGSISSLDEVMTGNGTFAPAITITTKGDTWEPAIDTTPTLNRELSKTAEEIYDKILKAGIIGMGGAGFPTAVKFALPEGKTVHTLIINGCECEPSLSSDHQLMLEQADEILVGVSLMMKALHTKRAVIGIEINKADAIDLLTQRAKEYPGISILALQVRYPQGAEKSLIRVVTGKEVASGALPLSLGVVVDNVGTAFAIYQAVQKNRPLIDRVVSIAGKEVRSPANIRVRIGTSLDALLPLVGGLPSTTGKVLLGGPMMGRATATTDVPISKATSGVLFISHKEASRHEPSNCIRCGECVTVCPMVLQPYLLEQFGLQQRTESSEEYGAADCIECGCCSYICPAHRPLLDAIRQGKKEVMQARRERSAK